LTSGVCAKAPEQAPADAIAKIKKPSVLSIMISLRFKLQV
jgi:hypothetical protein